MNFGRPPPTTNAHDSFARAISNNSHSQLPNTLLERLVPGYGLVSAFLLDGFNFDINILVTMGILIFTFHYAVTKAWKWIYGSIIRTYLMYSVYVDDRDDIYNDFMKWIALQTVSTTARQVKAVTGKGGNLDEPLDGTIDDAAITDDKGLFNFDKWVAMSPPRFEPYFGSHRFWHNGRLFVFQRSRKQLESTKGGYEQLRDEEVIELSCVGFSTKPVKELLDHVKSWVVEKQRALTVVRRPAPNLHRRYGGNWRTVASRPSRPMDTVVLDEQQKADLLADINEYLHPSSHRWYAERGIPYRRGYLFHGPPGTGKTSLSFAIAGVFRLEIYVISLLEPTLTEEDLGLLFNSLPNRCVVLLEDIDTAGLSREDGENGNEGRMRAISKSAEKDDMTSSKGGANEKGISLSGLLNAIDGVASHEGRLLVMTTNHPEKLDDALIRPGRVDMQVQFPLATKAQVRQLFIGMYTTYERPKASCKKEGQASTLMKLPSAHASNRLSAEELQRIADDFAALIPDGKFSPAEVQGFLLKRKKDPMKALEQVEEWRNALLEAKAKKSKVVEVQ